tara:strand:- start:27 stop:551 length:525 start_codon:yes stop_codon:yes gene_type:complete
MNQVIKKYKYYILPICLILVLSFSRILPHPSNFTPILAVGIFSGFYFRQFFLSSFIVILSMFIGDLYLGFHDTMFFTYVALIVAVGIGFMIKKFNYKEILFTGLSSSVCFFIITNFGAWLSLEMYEKNFSGLIQSYFMAIPFFHNTLISTFLYLISLKLIFEFSIKKKIFKSSF